MPKVKESLRSVYSHKTDRILHIRNFNFRTKERLGLAEVSQFCLKMPAITVKHLFANKMHPESTDAFDEVRCNHGETEA